ncbi:MAG TPA: hypothetical protein VFF90_13795 [Saprospiraceae bacterium]|nr:hypothetical protein [Saprospiraceae bacterium]
MSALPFRLKIGVTGHRSGLKADSLKEKVRSVLKMDVTGSGQSIPDYSFLSLCSPSALEAIRKLKETPVAFCIYTALAEGADRIVAEAVLEFDHAIMKVVLPLTEEDYEEDFDTPESLDEFRRLMGMDPNPIRLRKRRILEESLPDQELEHRRTAYYNVGKYIVDECDILIAVWDGQPAKGRGGTLDAIEYARSVQRPIILINSHNCNVVKMEGQLSFPPVMLSEIEHFNSFHPEEEMWKQYLDDLDSEYFDPAKFPEMSGLDPARCEQLSQHVFKPYAKASMLARSFKKQYMRVGLMIYVFSTLAVGIVLVSVIFDILHVWAFVFEFMLLSVIYTSIRFARESKVHARWLGYRFLAERIRSASYFFLAGFHFEEPMESEGNEYTSRNDASSMMYDEIWLPVNHFHNSNGKLNPKGDVNPIVLEYVRKSYVVEQLRFQERYSMKHHNKNLRLENAGRLLFFFAILAAVLHILLHTYPSLEFGMHWINNVLTFLALIFPTVAAALEGIRHKNEYARNTHRASIMASQLSKNSDEYFHVKTNEEFSLQLKKSAELILNDNEDWRNLMRERELEIVV